MVKIKPVHPLDATWIVIFDLAGYGDPEPGKMWIWVYEYDLDPELYPPAGYLGGWAADHVQATLMAKDLAELSQVLIDLLPQTHFSYWQGFLCPMLARWNIYRGIRGEPLLPVFHWDALADDPPPGYSW